MASTDKTPRISYTVSELAEQTGLTEGFFYKCIRDGRLRAYRPGGGARLIVMSRDAMRFLKGEGVRPSLSVVQELRREG